MTWRLPEIVNEAEEAYVGPDLDMGRRFRNFTVFAAMLGAMSCRPRQDVTATGDASRPAAESVCTGGPRDVSSVLDIVQSAHGARASELQRLVDGSRERVVRTDGGADLSVDELPRIPSCAASSDAVLRDRVGRALDALFTRKEARPHRARTVHVGVGCEESGRLLVSLHLAIGLGESVDGTYRVDERSAKPIVDGIALAHADLDGDGQRDVIWLAPDRQINVRFAGTDRTQKTALKLEECEDTDCSFAAVPPLESGVAIVRARQSYYPSSGRDIRIDERLRWNGKDFVSVDRITEDDFERRYETARERELAVLDDPMFGDFGKLRGELDRCAAVTQLDDACAALFERAEATLSRGGVADARAALRRYLGWRPCR